MGNWKVVVSGTPQDLTSTYGFNVQFSPGAGMAPLDNISTNFGLLDGALFQRTRVPSRDFQLIGYISASSGSALHAKRKALINVLKPDRSASQQAVILQYTGASDIVQASVFLDSGLELGRPSPANELDMALGFTQFNPYWEASTSTSQSLTGQSEISGVNYIIQRSAIGQWAKLGDGLNDQPNSIVTGPDGLLYVGGGFDQAGGATASRVAVWNSSTSAWSKVGNGANARVRTLSFGPDNSLYASGEFTSVSNVTACRVARWSGTAWATVGNGTNNVVYSHSLATDGTLYIGGEFSSVSNITTASGVAHWTGSAWEKVGNAASGIVLATAYNAGNLYIGGQFTTVCNFSASRVAYWTGSAWVAMGQGLGQSLVDALAIGSDGTVYAGGDFFATGGGVAACRVAAWNGAAWSSVGNGLGLSTEQVVQLRKGSDNKIYAVGTFTSIEGNIFAYSPAYFDGSRWQPVGIIVPSDTTAIEEKDGVITVGWNGTGTASVPGITSITNNGTAHTFPVITACAPASSSTQLFHLANFTTGESIYFNITLAAGEVATLDLRPGKKTFSTNFRPNVIGTILPVSDLATFKLLPGSNTVSFFTGGGAATTKISWTARYWGIDS